MPDEEYTAEVLNQYYKLVLAATGLVLSDWGYARSVQEVTRHVLERRYFYHPALSLQQEAEILVALEELDKCPVRQVGIPGTWGQIQEQLRRTVPLAVYLLQQGAT
jgi:hypothetical protein